MIGVYDNLQGSNIFLVPSYLNVDLYNDFPLVAISMSARNPTLVNLCNNVLHSTPYGFLKDADTYFYFIKYLASLGF